jgi:hypothetical protein
VLRPREAVVQVLLLGPPVGAQLQVVVVLGCLVWQESQEPLGPLALSGPLVRLGLQEPWEREPMCGLRLNPRMFVAYYCVRLLACAFYHYLWTVDGETWKHCVLLVPDQTPSFRHPGQYHRVH